MSGEGGAERWISVSGRPLLDESGSVSGTVFVCRDVTEARNTESALSLGHRQLSTFHRIAEIIRLEPDIDRAYREITREISVNTGFPIVTVELHDPDADVMVFMGFHGLAPGGIDGELRIPRNETLSGLVIESGRTLVECDALSRVEFGNPMLRAERIRTFISAPLTFERKTFGALSLANPDTVRVSDRLVRWVESLGGYLAVLIERKRTAEALERREEELRQAQKMEAIGRLAGGVAHDFNNLLTAISGYAEIARSRTEPESTLRAPMEQIIRAAGRAASLTRKLLAFSRKQVLRPELLDVNEVVADMAVMLRRLVGENLSLETRLGEESVVVRADRVQLEQVLMNLVVNSRDAMPGGGRIRILTGRSRITEGTCRCADHSCPPGDYVTVSVEDTGEGIEPAILDRIFEPFFTTKAPAKGTGLGLSTVYGIVRQSGGGIQVESRRGEGARFKVYLPRATAAPAAKPQRIEHEVMARPTRRFETLLLVEDDDAVRELAREVLVSDGYAVLDALSGEEALEVAAAHAEPIHLMVTDLVMPGMSGEELARRLVRIHPETRVIYSSGYPGDALADGLAPGPRAFLGKPYSPDDLSRAVRNLLDGTDGRSSGSSTREAA